MTLDKYLQNYSIETKLPVQVISNGNAPKFTKVPSGERGEVICCYGGIYDILWHSSNITEHLNVVGMIAGCLEVLP